MEVNQYSSYCIFIFFKFCINCLKEVGYKDFFTKFKNEFFSKNKSNLNIINISSINDNITPGKIGNKIKNDKINSFSFIVKERYKILNLKNHQIINVNLKSASNNTLNDVSINNAEKIIELKQQLIKKNDNHKIIILYLYIKIRY